MNLPGRGEHRRENLDILLHELVHVLQYERAGSRYFAEALVAQHEEGYGYGGAAGLVEAHAAMGSGCETSTGSSRRKSYKITTCTCVTVGTPPRLSR